MGRLDNQVAFITGAARGQGRSHALRLAEEGADVIAVDICQQVPSVAYKMSTPEDLNETVHLVEASGRRIVAHVVDVRDQRGLGEAFQAGVAELGHCGIVVANAGIMPFMGPAGDSDEAWGDAIDIMLNGVYNTLRVTVPHLISAGRGGSIIITSSSAGLKGFGPWIAGSLGYTAAKHGVVGLMRQTAAELARYQIRCNSVHPTGCNTPMVVNEEFAQWTEQYEESTSRLQNALPVEMVEPVDVSNAVAYLASDEARYVTGLTMTVDAGFLVR